MPPSPAVRDHALLALWLGLILGCTFFGRLAGPWLEGPQNKARTLALVGLAGLAALLWLTARARRLPKGRRWPTLLAILAGGLSLGALAWTRQNHVEAIHVVIFGALGVLTWRAAGHRWQGRARLALALAFGLAVGAGDEFIQHLHPNRVGDVADVIVNGVSSAVACLLAASVSGGWWPRPLEP